MNSFFSKPNQITYIRILLIPIFAIFLLVEIPYNRYIAAVIFLVLSLSDAFDGYIARKKNQKTEFGSILDPIADKLLISTALLILVGKGVESWMAIVIIAREWLITLLRLLIVYKRVVPADNLGKIKTAVQTVAILSVILNLPFNQHIMLIAVILTLVSGIGYLIKITKALDERILNIPNMITFMRFALLPLFVLTLINSQKNYSLIIFSIIAVSDKIDGISARVMKQMTEFGKAFDSFTDWSVFLVSFFLFAFLGYIDFIWAVLLVIPAVTISSLKLAFIKKNRTVPVTPTARISVAMAYATVISILIDFPYKDQVLWAMFALVYLSMVRYLVLFRSELRRA
ncbi:MAG: CDP-diacylglycerol--glycerol-3-phosphate 3-phosphatidyltransferase [Nanoarchaeota archaeon]